MSKIEKETIKQGYRVWFDEANIIANVSVSGEVDLTSMDKVIKEASLLVEKIGVKSNWLIDVTKVTKPILSSLARKTMYKNAKQLTNQVNKIAIIGASALVKVVTRFVLTAAGKQDINFFSTREEALKWFKED